MGEAPFPLASDLLHCHLSASADPFSSSTDAAQRAERTPYQVFCADGITYLGLRPPARTAGAPDPARSTTLIMAFPKPDTRRRIALRLWGLGALCCVALIGRVALLIAWAQATASKASPPFASPHLDGVETQSDPVARSSPTGFVVACLLSIAADVYGLRALWRGPAMQSVSQFRVLLGASSLVSLLFVPAPWMCVRFVWDGAALLLAGSLLRDLSPTWFSVHHNPFRAPIER